MSLQFNDPLSKSASSSRAENSLTGGVTPQISEPDVKFPLGSIVRTQDTVELTSASIPLAEPQANMMPPVKAPPTAKEDPPVKAEPPVKTSSVDKEKAQIPLKVGDKFYTDKAVISKEPFNLGDEDQETYKNPDKWGTDPNYPGYRIFQWKRAGTSGVPSIDKLEDFYVKFPNGKVAALTVDKENKQIKYIDDVSKSFTGEIIPKKKPREFPLKVGDSFSSDKAASPSLTDYKQFHDIFGDPEKWGADPNYPGYRIFRFPPEGDKGSPSVLYNLYWVRFPDGSVAYMETDKKTNKILTMKDKTLDYLPKTNK